MSAQELPVLVMMPGLQGTDDLFAPLLDHLPASWRTFCISYPADPHMDCNSHVDFVREQLPHGRPVVLLAESFSGPVAYRLAQHERSVVKGVIFCASFVSPPHPVLLRVSEHVPLARLMATRLSRLVARRRLLGADPPPEVEAMLEGVMKRSRPEVLAHRLRCVGRLGRPDERLDVPCCCIRPTRDRLIPPRSIYDIRGAFRHVRVVEIEAPHMVLQVRPQASAEAITSFLNTLSGA